MPYSSILKPKAPIDTHVFIVFSIAYTTSFFRTLSFVQTQIISIIFLVYFSYRFFGIFIINKKLSFFLYNSIFIFFCLFLYSTLNYDKYLFLYSYKFLICNVFALLASKLISRDIKRYLFNFHDLVTAKYIFILYALNFIFYLLHHYFNLNPFFVIKSDSINTREYFHFIFTAPGELDRFISFFGEPSFFILIGTVIVFTFINYRKYVYALLCLFFLSVSFSASLPFAYFFVFIYILFNSKVLSKYFIILILSFIFICLLNISAISDYFNMASQLSLENEGLNKLVMRFFDNQGNFQITRLLILSSIPFTLLPQQINPDYILIYGNPLIYIIARFGILSLPYIYLIFDFKISLLLTNRSKILKYILVLCTLFIVIIEYWVLILPLWFLLLPSILSKKYK